MMKKLLKLNKKRSAFSLLEVLISVSLFSVIILSMTSIFKVVIDSQRTSIATQNVQESLKYFLEVVNKEIRMAVRSEGSCFVPSGDIFYLQETVAGDYLYFQNYYGECVIYSVENIDDDLSRFKISRDGVSGYISPDKISVDRLDFVLGTGINKQDLITINIQARSLGTREAESELSLQTSLSSRYYK